MRDLQIGSTVANQIIGAKPAFDRTGLAFLLRVIGFATDGTGLQGDASVAYPKEIDRAVPPIFDDRSTAEKVLPAGTAMPVKIGLDGLSPHA